MWPAPLRAAPCVNLGRRCCTWCVNAHLPLTALIIAVMGASLNGPGENWRRLTTACGKIPGHHLPHAPATKNPPGPEAEGGGGPDRPDQGKTARLGRPLMVHHLSVSVTVLLQRAVAGSSGLVLIAQSIRRRIQGMAVRTSIFCVGRGRASPQSAVVGGEWFIAPSSASLITRQPGRGDRPGLARSSSGD